ncbi:MAG TPA: hypothetical protein VF581_01860 [Flavobacterium sp.]
MKKIFLFLAIAGMTVFQGCEGPQGEPGNNFEAEVFEVEADFTVANDWYLTYALDPVMLPEDNLLIYELVNTNDNIDTWALLPQVYYLNGGEFQYNFNYSYDQFSIFIDTNLDFATLPNDRTQDKIFRIVIVPGYFAKNGTKVNHSNYNEVIEFYNIDDSKVKRLN